MPIVFSDKKHSDIVDKNFINAYIADFDFPEFDDQVTIVRHREVKRYEVPQEYFEDYVKIQAGAYRETSVKYKELITSFWEVDDKSKLYEILYKDKTDKELLPAFDLSEEVYNIGVPL